MSKRIEERMAGDTCEWVQENQRECVREHWWE